MILFLLAFVAFLIIGIPISVSIGFSAVLGCLSLGYPLVVIGQKMVSGIDSWLLIAIPLFILAGNIMAQGITQKLINAANVPLGRVRGSLASVTVLSSALFGAISGSGPATTAAVGMLMIPAMAKRGYNVGYAAAATATAGGIGIIIPPSIPMVIYGVSGQQSISKMFMAGIIPGILIAIGLSVMHFFLCRNLKTEGLDWSMKTFIHSLRDGFWSILAPVIILGGIYWGVFTPTEAAEVGVLWTLFVGLFVYRKLTWKNISSALIRTSAFAGSATILVGVSMAFSRLLTLYHIPQTVGAFLGSISTDPTITLLLIAFFIFLCGFVADTLAMVVVLAPVFLPITNALGIHPIQLGILFVVCCETGFLTPPFGANLFITMKITDVKLEEVALRAFPYLLAMWLLIIVVAACPDFVMFLPRLLM